MLTDAAVDDEAVVDGRRPVIDGVSHVVDMAGRRQRARWRRPNQNQNQTNIQSWLLQALHIKMAFSKELLHISAFNKIGSPPLSS